MPDREPFVGSEKRPDLRLEPGKRIGDITLGELRALLSDPKIKSSLDGVAKDTTADKQSADEKLSSDIKSHSDKLSKDLQDTDIVANEDLTVRNARVIELFRRLLAGFRANA